MAMQCKAEGCKANESLEDSGYCFTCAEEMACLLAEEGLPTWSAWYSVNPTGGMLEAMPVDES